MGVRKRRQILGAVLGVLCLAAAACGNDPPQDTDPADSAAAGERVAGVASGRASAGIAAAGGLLREGPACSEAGAGAVKIAWVGPDLAELAHIGLESLVLDEPSLIVDAYIDDLNRHGGIGGSCLALVDYAWELSDPESSLQQICADLLQESPLALFSFSLNNATLRCATLGAQIPTLGVLTAVPEASLAAAEGGLFVDGGSVEYLLSASLNVARVAGEVGAGDRIGLLVTDGASAASETEAARRASQTVGLPIVASASVPTEFGAVGVAVAESQVRLMETGLSDSEIDQAVRSFGRLEPAQVSVLRSLERFFLDTASQMRAAEVTVVVASASAPDVRRLMRAAEQVDWTPRWLTSDAQPAVLALTNSPERQVQNLLQVSSRRAAGDQIPEVDRGCISLRNSLPAAPPFAHRIHTDAWSLATSTCDFLDVVFGAMTRIDGPFTRAALVDVLSTADYETDRGARIRFAAGDRNGAERFRVLKADPECVLNTWGCMRAISDWFSADAVPADPSSAAAG
jgi:hypothetical protein